MAKISDIDSQRKGKPLVEKNSQAETQYQALTLYWKVQGRHQQRALALHCAIREGEQLENVVVFKTNHTARRNRN